MSRYHFRPNGGAALMLVAALVGAGIALWSYFDRSSGIGGTAGAMLVVVSSLLLALDALIFFFLPSGALRATIATLGFLGAIGTLVAAWFLHAWWLMAAIVLVVLALILALAVRSRERAVRTA